MSSLPCWRLLPLTAQRSGERASPARRPAEVLCCGRAGVGVSMSASLSPLQARRTSARCSSRDAAEDAHEARSLLLLEAPESRTNEALELSVSSQRAALGACALGGLFVLLTADVSSGAHAVGGLDQAVHVFVREHSSVDQRLYIQTVLSNVPIATGLLMDGAACALLLRRGNRARAVAVSLICYTVGFGALLPLHDDGLLGFVKALIERARPTDIAGSWAYPSGHTSLAAFLWMSAWATLLPRLRVPMGVSVPVLVAVGTGLCRVGADVHWVSDVIAGGCFGTGLALGCEALVQGMQRNHDEL